MVGVGGGGCEVLHVNTLNLEKQTQKQYDIQSGFGTGTVVPLGNPLSTANGVRMRRGNPSG
eukprot:scaffold229415_cov29-Tisochrysis_lutea.AAC.5